MQYLELAFYFSALAYYLGALLRALPLPFPSIKRLSRTLMGDGIFSMALVFSYKLILYAISYISGALGASWPAFNVYVASRASVLLMYIASLKLIGMALSAHQLSFVAQSTINPVISLLTSSLAALLSVWTLLAIFSRIGGQLIALGILLHSIPLRLARGVGAMLISMTIIFTICGPLLPLFSLSMLAAAYEPVAQGAERCGALFEVVDALGGPVPYSTIEGRDEELLYRYVANSSGLREVSKSLEGVPCSPHQLYVVLADNRFALQVEESYYEDDSLRLRITLSGLISLRGLEFLVIEGEHEAELLRVNESFAEARIRAIEPIRLLLYAPGAGTRLYVNGTPAEPAEASSVEYLGRKLRKEAYALSEGDHEVLIPLSPLGDIPVARPEYPYLATLLMRDELELGELMSIAVMFYFELFLSPLIYVFMLLSMSYSLSRLLGGAAPRVARALVGV